MKGKWKWVVIVLIAIVVIGSLAGGNDSDEPKKTGEVSPSGTTKSTGTSQKEKQISRRRYRRDNGFKDHLYFGKKVQMQESIHAAEKGTHLLPHGV